MEYARLTEHNEHEGETWHFYIPLEGNVDAIAALEALIEEHDPEGEEYELADRNFTEAEVDLLAKYGDTTRDGYMAGHNKLAGTLNFTDDTGLHSLYKGGIKGLMTGGQ
jgi:hypothetical protein